VYAAYFTYDADAHTRYAGQRGENYTVQVGSGDNRRTETRTRWYSVSGQVQNQFDDLTVLANDGFDPDHVHDLEPWPTASAQPFSPEFLAGHLCRTYDKDIGECFGEAQNRMKATIDQTVRRDIGGDKQRVDQVATDFQDLSFKHLLLPIWLLTISYGGKPFQTFINGATGGSGDYPWSKVKIPALVIARCRDRHPRRRVREVGCMGPSSSLVVVVAVGSAARWPSRPPNASSAANELIPGRASAGPAEWAGAHTPEARLHRRLVDVVDALRAHPLLEEGTGRLEARVELEEQVAAIDER
jgi:hypothetical protein